MPGSGNVFSKWGGKVARLLTAVVGKELVATGLLSPLLSQQSPLDMSWQPVPCLLLPACLHAQEWRIKRSAFWLPLKGCPNYQRQMACLILKITLMCKAAERTVFCYLHLKEHKPQCRVTLFASNRPFSFASTVSRHQSLNSIYEALAFSRKERLKRKENHERRQECIKTLSTTPTSMNQHDAECFQTCLGVHWHDQAWVELIRDAFLDE